MKDQSISLRFKQGSSNKVYNVSLERLEKDPDNAGWVVNFSYGPYGKTLTYGTKTGKPISFERAQKLYNKVVTEKTSKGYTVHGDGTPFKGSQIAQKRTNLYPQLLNEITKEDIPEVLARFGGTLALQTKHDGERRVVIAENGVITGSNRRALEVGIHPRVVLALQDLTKEIHSDFILDCEDMGASLVIFDVLKFEELELRSQPFEYRTQFLKALSGTIAEMCIDDILICDIPTVYSNVNTVYLDVEHAESCKEEGVVLRDLRASYTAGKPNSGGPCLKLKFWASATCQVKSLHPTKRSIALELLDNTTLVLPCSPGWKHEGTWIGVGNCTVPTNYDMPCVGDLVEIKYLYAYRLGSIYQPQYKGIRTDLTAKDPVLSQLKYKA